MRTLFSLVVVLVLSCAPAWAQKVAVDFDGNFEFSVVKTVAWAQGTPATNEFNQQRIERAVEAQLTAAGYEIAAPEAPVDLYVITHAGGHASQKKSNVSVGIGLSRRTSRGSVGIGTSTGGKTKTVETGTLVIQLVDSTNDKLVWRADLSDTIEGDAQKMEAKINRAVEKAFKKYPPAPKKK